MRILFLLSLFLLAACAPADQSPGTPVAQQETASTGDTPTEAAAVGAAPTDPPSPAAVTAAPTSTTTVQPESPPAPATSLPAATAEPTAIVVATLEPTAGPQIVTGRTADGAYFIGAVDAPVTIIDYSDFL